MAAKLLHSLTDDNPDLQKQIGCMTGIFQMFDRQQMVVSGRRIADQSQRKTLPRHSQFSNGNLEEEYHSAYQRQPAEMNSNKNAYERQRFSTESSRASFSSSRSSSFSSVDYCRGTQPDPAYNDRITFSEAAFEDSRCSISPRIARGLSVKNINREDSMSRAVTQRDPPRDLKLHKTVDGPRSSDSQNVRDNLKESIKVLSKLQGAGWPYNDRQEHKSKEPSHLFSDGMETSRFSFDSRETLSASKLRDLPRLSLDGRERLMRRGDCDSLSNFRLEASLERSCSTKEKGQNPREVSGTHQQRPPSLVAKLMGLTAMPDSTLARRKDTGLIEAPNIQDEYGNSNLEKPMLDSKKEPDSPRWITSEMKPISSSRIPVEPAPWKNQDKGGSLLKQSSRRVKSPTRQANPFPSVYSEIEKRFKDIEFNQSGKDLRALKQILESIHAKGILEDEKQDQASYAATSRKKHELTLIKGNQKNASVGQQNARGEHLTEIIPRRGNSWRPLDSPIVIMKPISRSPRSQTSKIMYKDHAVSFNEKSKSTQNAGRPQQQQSKDTSSGSPRNHGSISPRTRLKKLESEKQNQFLSHSSDANRNRVPVSKQPAETSSPGGKFQQKISNKQQNCGQISEILLEIKKLRSLTNEAPLPADINVTMDSKRDKAATPTARSNKLNGSHSPSKRASKQAVLASSQLSNHISLPVQLDETAAPEHPSPVSVLNTSPYMDDLGTEEKQLTTPPEDFAPGYSAYTKSNLSGGELGLTSEISRRKLVSIDSLVQKLKRLNSTHDESRTDYIASLCDTTNPDHRYISEILLASGLLLGEFGSSAKPFPLHPSGNLINPELFNVLEQTKSRAPSPKINQPLNEEDINADADDSKSHRKLIFDAVNHILIKKLAISRDLPDYPLKLHKLANKALSTQNLIKELCTDMEQFQQMKKMKKKKTQEFDMEDDIDSDGLKDLLWQDVMQSPPDSWTFYDRGVSEVVLDIERSLFKNLVNEIVSSGAVACRLRPKSGNGRTRFVK